MNNITYKFVIKQGSKITLRIVDAKEVMNFVKKLAFYKLAKDGPSVFITSVIRSDKEEVRDAVLKALYAEMKELKKKFFFVKNGAFSLKKAKLDKVFNVKGELIKVFFDIPMTNEGIVGMSEKVEYILN